MEGFDTAGLPSTPSVEVKMATYGDDTAVLASNKYGAATIQEVVKKIAKPTKKCG